MMIGQTNFQKVVFEMKKLFALISVIFAATGLVFSQEQKFADIGNFRLENGEVIKNCKIGYRTFGAMNADKSNVVVYLTWAGGNTSQVNLKPDDESRMIDTKKYFVVAIDALSNGGRLFSRGRLLLPLGGRILRDVPGLRPGRRHPAPAARGKNRLD